MWDTLFKLLPPPVLLGLVIYSAVTFLWLQPLIERRMADLIYIPQCERGDLPKIVSRRPDPAPPVIQGPLPDGSVIPMPPAPPVEPPLGVQIISGLKDLLRGDDNPYSVPAGAAGSICGCSVALAFDSVFWRSHIHVMSLRTYTPRAIRHFDERVAQARATGLCG
ncbi:hypothetical protein [Nitratireductor alexandrii]|uniref:hypothetical protein n=1 Tax=Nitratireductor alexandrii TaxID=2448161 RepID=UPI000FDC7853|nr:hypothetical protein [Nitratireductor alexandrii]